jgi:ATP-dependent DNA helicase DinG
MQHRNRVGDTTNGNVAAALTEPPALRDAIALLIRLSGTIPGYRDRPAQQQMVKDVFETLSGITGKRHLLIEASTGTGKTFAYLIGAILAARAKGLNVVVSTATIGLEEQLVEQVLPALLPHLTFQPHIALAKGRSRYVCPPRLTQALVASAEPEAEVLGALAHHLADGWDGDRDHLPTLIDPQAWRTVVIDQRSCSARRCDWYQECPYYRARNRIADANIIIANHDLVIADLDAGGGVHLPRPEDNVYVFDEGHHLPDRARHGFARHVQIESFQSSLNRIHADLEPVTRAARDIETNLLVSGAEHAARDLHRAIDRLLSGFSNFGPLMVPDVDPVSRCELSETEIPEALSTIVVHLEEESARLDISLTILHARVAALRGQGKLTADIAESVLLGIGVHRSRVRRHLELWRSFRSRAEPGRAAACWVESGDKDGVVGHRVSHVPIAVAERMRRVLWDRAAGTIVTGATLAESGAFTVIREELGLNNRDDVAERILPQTLDTSRAVMNIPPMTTTPTDHTAHLREVADMLPEILAGTGTALVLFASRAEMRQVIDGLPESLRADILEQDAWPRMQLLARHRERAAAGLRSVLAGVAGLAEGLDLPGGLCQHLVITRIPFPPPDDPVWAARSRLVKKSGGNAFREIMIPEAARRLVHAAGRLLRHESDEGKITWLDRRILNKSYGKLLRRSMPLYAAAIEKARND